MTTTLKGLFETRQMAEMAVERLVQEFDVDRTKISIGSAGPENTAGEKTGLSRPDPDDEARNGKISVSVQTEGNNADKVRQAFKEFQSSEIGQA